MGKKKRARKTFANMIESQCKIKICVLKLKLMKSFLSIEKGAPAPESVASPSSSSSSSSDDFLVFHRHPCRFPSKEFILKELSP